MKKQWYVLSLIGAAIVGARWSELSVNHGPPATSPESISKPAVAVPAETPISPPKSPITPTEPSIAPAELPIAPPMTEEDRNKLFAALLQHADPQAAPVQDHGEVLRNVPGAPPASRRSTTPSQQVAAKDKVAAVKPHADPAPSASAMPACDAPSPNSIRDTVRKKLHNPDSAQFGAVMVLCGDQFDGSPMKIICGSVNTKNTFGAYAGRESYLIVAELGVVEVPASAEDWNKYCGGSYKGSVTLPESMMQSS